jgi:hypothetical protein
MPTSATKTASGAKPARKKARRSTKAPARRTSRATTRTNARGVTPQRALHETQLASRDTAEVVGDYAERAVLIPVGAALIARDRMVSSVSEAFSNYSSPARAQAQLRRFERRGTTARKRLEREVRKARVRVERELRQRRREIKRSVNDIDTRRGAVAKNGGELASRVQERILSIV